MSKAPSPLLGFNNNIRHKGRVFHVQTEDSGVRHPHVITHLFMDGGRILKTTKTSYAEHLGTENMGEVVRKMMKEQHKAMFVALREGAFDAVIGKHFGATEEVKPEVANTRVETLVSSSSPQNEAIPASALQPEVSVDRHSSGEIPAAARAAPAQAAPAAPTSQPAMAAAAPVSTAAPVSSSPQVPRRISEPEALVVPPVAALRVPELNAPPRRPSSVPAMPAEPGRPASNPPRQAPPGDRIPFASELPPPPANVLQTNRPEGGYRELSPEAVRPSAYSEVSNTSQRSSSKMPVAPPRPSSGRFISARPSTSNRPPDAQSLFGDDLNEKSLDEVILSYLAEDLDAAPGSKK